MERLRDARLLVLGGRPDSCLRNKGAHLVNLLNPVQFLQSPMKSSATPPAPFLLPAKRRPFATEKLWFLNINLLLIPTFPTHHSDKIRDFLSKLRLKLEHLLLIKFNPRLQISSLRRKEFYPHWYGCSSLSSKNILSKFKLYSKSPKMEEVKWWVSEKGKF